MSASVSAARRSGGRPRNGGQRGKADMHLHTLYSDGTATLRELLDHVEHATDLDLIAITDHERIDGARRACELHAAGDYSFDLVVGEEITTRRGHLLALFLDERVPPLRPLPETLERVHAQGGIAVAAHPMAMLIPSIGASSLRFLHADPDPAHRLDAIEVVNPSTAGRVRDGARRQLNDELLTLPEVGNSDAHVLEGVGTAWTWFPGARADDYRGAIAAGSTAAEGTFWSHAHNLSVYRRQLAAKARHLRHTLRPTGEWR
jgi:Predicted metal-dependent phosphoesterases (PHP family)